MAAYEKVKRGEIIMGRLGHGCDLSDELTRICVERNVTLGRVEAIGAVRKACIGFYDQTARAYRFAIIDRPMEITNLTGNISLKDGRPFVHAHVTLADEEGTIHGGHLAVGTLVFACEFMIESFDGPAFDRRLDEDTGLSLWALPT